MTTEERDGLREVYSGKPLGGYDKHLRDDLLRALDALDAMETQLVSVTRHRDKDIADAAEGYRAMEAERDEAQRELLAVHRAWDKREVELVADLDRMRERAIAFEAERDAARARLLLIDTGLADAGNRALIECMEERDEAAAVAAQRLKCVAALCYLAGVEGVDEAKISVVLTKYAHEEP